MNKIKSWIGAAFAAGLLLATPASAQWYIGGDAGVAIYSGSDLSISGGGGKRNGTYDPVGFTGLLQAGYDFGGPRLEIEGGYRYAGFKEMGTQRLGTLTTSGDAQIASFMVNGLYSFLPNSSWHPFIGAGIGAAYRRAEINSTLFGRNLQLKGNDWSFAYQGMAGVAYDITSSLAAKLQYRYFATADKMKMTLNVAQNIPFEADAHKEHSVLLGVTYKFR